MIHVILLHGLGCNPVLLLPLEKCINAAGLEETKRLTYPVDLPNVKQMASYIDCEMSLFIDKNKDKVIVIGQSLGGLVANELHKFGWHIILGIYIVTPLKGAKFLDQLEFNLPKIITDYYRCSTYTLLQNRDSSKPPPHPYRTISASWPGTDFDGCLYVRETQFDPKYHIHFSCSDHRLIFLNPGLFLLVAKLCLHFAFNQYLDVQGQQNGMVSCL